jgi:hypothetical protein
MTIDLNTTNPLSFIDWKQYYADNQNASELSILYNNYLVDWKTAKEEKAGVKSSYKRSIYTQFLKNLTLDTIDSDIANFLNNIDTDDIYELELGVHYFVQIIRNQLLSVKELRDEATFSTTKNKLKTSKAGIKAYLKNHIAKLLSNKDFVTKNTETDFRDINVAKIANAINIEIDHYVSDENYYNIHPIDSDLANNLPNRVYRESISRNIYQVIAINKNGSQCKVETNNISTPGALLGINEPYTDYKRLPNRYFRNEIKTLENLRFTIERNLINKYLANDIYKISGNKESTTTEVLHEAVNPTNNLTQRYGPNLYGNIVNEKNTNLFPYQLSYKNTGANNFNSFGLTFNIDISAFNGQEYVIPNPHQYEPGLKVVGYIKDKQGNILKNIKIKQRTPLRFNAKTNTFKNNDLADSVGFYNNKIIRNYGYQSLENSLEYSTAGINKKEDSISFWEDAEEQLDWKNTDTYPISVLNIYPESKRLDDLLITNRTGMKLRSDVYGNEFYFVKSVYPKRKAGTAYISEETSTTASCTTAAEFYDGLYFEPMLSAISAAKYQSDGTLYTSVTGMYDTFIYSDTSVCTGASAEGFAAPLTDFHVYGGTENQTNTAFPCSDLHTIALSCGSVSAVSAIDGGPFKGHPGKSNVLVEAFFVDTVIPYFVIDSTQIYSNITTTYESASLNQPTSSKYQLFEQQHEEYGEIFVRNITTQEVLTLKESMSAVFNKHSTSIKNRIYQSKQVTDFDIVEDTIYIQTSNETITEKYTFIDGIFKNNAGSKSIIT